VERSLVRMRTMSEMQVRRSCSAISWLFVSLTFALLLLPAAAERVEDLPKPSDYISDFAHVLSPQTVARLNRLCGQLDHSATNAQVAVVTIRNLDGDDASDFANRLEEKWKVGKKGSDRGILMLFAIDDRKRWIEIGLGLQGILPDAKVGDIGRLMVPDLRRADYNGAITTGVVQIANVIAADAKVSLSEEPQDQLPRRQQPKPAHLSVSVIFRIIIILIVLGFFVLRFLGRFGLFALGGPWFGGWGGGGGGGFSGGGGGGGSSGGDSGFGGFGGGESDGGGAGGDW
jgi:uncharacterized protein